MSNLLFADARNLMGLRCEGVIDATWFQHEAARLLEDAPMEERLELSRLLSMAGPPPGARLDGSDPLIRTLPAGPTVPPPAPTKPVLEKKVEAPLPQALKYTDHRLVTAILYLKGKLLANHEVARGGATHKSGMRCRIYQILVRQYQYPDGSSGLGLLWSHDPLVQPELLRQKNPPEQQLAPGSIILDVPVESIRDGLPYICGGAPGDPGVLTWTSEDEDFENMADSIRLLAEINPAPVFPRLATWIMDGLPPDGPTADLVCFNTRETHHVQWAEPARCCYLEPRWPGNGMPSSRQEFREFMTGLEKSHYNGWCFRYMTSPTVTVPRGQQLNLRVLGSPADAEAVRGEGAKVFVNLLPLTTPDGRRMLDANGVPKNSFSIEEPTGSRRVPDKAWEKWRQTRAVEAMGAVMQCR